MPRPGQSEGSCLPISCDWVRKEHVTQTVPMSGIPGTSCWSHGKTPLLPGLLSWGKVILGMLMAGPAV